MNVLSHYLLWSMGLARATTQTSDAERLALRATQHRSGCLAEIGVWHGEPPASFARPWPLMACCTRFDPFPLGGLG